MNSQNNNGSSRVAVVGGARTPFVKAGGVFSELSFLDLGVEVVDGFLDKAEIEVDRLDELVFSTVLLDPRTPNAARELVFKSRLLNSLPAHFISNNCISGLVAVNYLAEGIKVGRIRSGLAGGSESMSRPTLTFRRKAEDLFLGLSRARTFGQRLGYLSKYRPSFMFPVPPSPKEPSTGLTMGQHCEITAKEFGVTREAQDSIALNSHLNAVRARDAGYFDSEIFLLEEYLQIIS